MHVDLYFKIINIEMHSCMSLICILYFYQQRNAFMHVDLYFINMQMHSCMSFICILINIEMYSCMLLIFTLHLYQHRNAFMHVVDLYIAFVLT